MCGISGIVGCGNRAVLERMTDAIAHRGPDDSGVLWLEEHRLGLGHRRLSIIDLSPAGHQPMSDDESNLWIVFNGEIYNYREIRAELQTKGHSFRSNSDTEVLLKAYRQWGENCLARLNGMFAFVIYDVESRKLFAARDRLGVKPFYYWHDGEALVFASEIKALLASRLAPCTPDYEALHTPTRFQVSPLTGFKGIRKLSPGECLNFEAGQLTLRRYWSLKPSEKEPASESKLIDRLEHLLKDAVALQMIADVPVGVFLSGGLDSSIVASLVRQNTNADVHSFTIKFSEGDQKFERMPRDDVFARQVAQQLGFRHHEFEIKPDVAALLPRVAWHLDEPLSDPAAINLLLMSEAAREHGIIVMLSGMGGDEIFGGYRKHLACLKADTYQSLIPQPVRRVIESSASAIPVGNRYRGWRSTRWLKRFLSFASLPRAERYLSSDLSLSPQQLHDTFAAHPSYWDSYFYRAQAPLFAGNGVSYLTKMCLNDTQVFLPDHNLMYSDKASMAAGIEGRPPLTDHRVVELMFSLPSWTRIKGNTQKYLLKRVSERHLPSDVVYRPKAPFASPLRSWIRGALAPMVDDLLSHQTIRQRGLYDADYVCKLIAKDRAGMEDNSLMIWTLLNVEVWFRTFFSNWHLDNPVHAVAPSGSSVIVHE